MAIDTNYINQRLAALGGGNDSTKEVEELRAENARLKEQLGQMPQANFKSEVQAAFEQSAEFEQLLNLFYMRMLREKFGLDFKATPYMQEFQSVANQAFEQFEKSYKNKEVTKNASTGKKFAGGSEADTAKNA